MKIPVDAVLYTHVSASSLGALRGHNKGQYDLRLGSDLAIGEFFSELPEESPTEHGGWTKWVTFEPFEGANPVDQAKSRHRLRFMGPNAKRKNDHYFAAQQPSSQYPLWGFGRAFATSASNDDLANDVVLIIKDNAGGFHARWVPASEIGSLPSQLTTAIITKRSGVWQVNSNAGPSVSPLAMKIIGALREHHNVLLYGPPATGKTHLISEVQKSFTDGTVTVDTTAETQPLSDGSLLRTSWATFHQSYSYEDFLIGVRPDNSRDGAFTLVPSPGILLELAEWARVENHESLLVIDEINRGNVSKIFGEFITLMEPDKRLGADGSISTSTVSIRLPFVAPDASVSVEFGAGKSAVVPNPFTMPHRLYTLATMNSVDKSVAPLDAALRRRFHVIDLRPDFSQFESEENDSHPGIRNGRELLKRINRDICIFLGTDYQFGQWYLAELVNHDDANSEELLRQLWTNKIFPQLEEHFLGRSEQFLSVLAIDQSHGAVEVLKPSAREDELGGAAVVLAKSNASASDVLASITKIIER